MKTGRVQLSKNNNNNNNNNNNGFKNQQVTFVERACFFKQDTMLLVGSVLASKEKLGVFNRTMEVWDVATQTRVALDGDGGKGECCW